METKKKKIPERRCVGCGETKEKKALIRVVRTPEGEVVLDVTGKKSGRGAYICHSLSCFKKARKSKRFETNLSVEIPDEIYDKLEKELTESAI
ncbi:MAG: YlxR family protein [Ruminococcaceae bacterium]|nr:YlxR family protein [Oscillospiraceae bacterium]